MRRLHIYLKEGLGCIKTFDIFDAIEARGGRVVSSKGNCLEVELPRFRFAEHLHKLRLALCKRPWQPIGASGPHYVELIEPVDEQDNSFVYKALCFIWNMCEFIANVAQDAKSSRRAR